jgi:ubiquinone/menaquinone biosynthesis C-methylase UbiE
MKKHSSTYGSQDHYYENFYSLILGKKSTGIFHYLSSYPHKLMEKPFPSNAGMRILEIGVGAGEHMGFVQGDFAEYVAVDKSERSINSLQKEYPGVKAIQADAESLPFPKNSFDRLIATCLFAHLDNPESSLLRWSDLVKDGGTMTIYLPSEPSLALRIFRYLLPRRKASKMGFAGYALFIAREHKSSLPRMLSIIKEYFHPQDLRIVRRPFPVLGWYLNLFYVVHITVRRGK